jgi:pyruvate/2-oxoglutarate dehydrogenase complex dihydrolipoamide dehydrogenase (E3) component
MDRHNASSFHLRLIDTMAAKKKSEDTPAGEVKGETLTPDICVIGAGSGGLVVAAAAASFGVDVVLIEKGKMGGDCLNYGCVPSKAIIAAAKHAHAARTAPDFGVMLGAPKVNFRKVHDHIHDVIASIAPMDSVERFESLGVNVIKGHGEFIDKKTVKVGRTLIKARRFVVATGSSPFVPPIPGIETVEHFTNETLFYRTKAPGNMIIIGGGPIGMEMAQAHARLGANVTVVEGEKALGKDDPECAALVLEKLRGEGIEILEGTKVTRVEKGKAAKGAKSAKIKVSVESAEGSDFIEGDTLLVATGRVANVAGVGLDEAKIKHTRRGITVNKRMRTSNKRVYAVGDVAGSLQFTHMAGYHAGLVIRNILFRLRAKENTHIIPWATYTQPELAHIGHTEASAREAKVKGIAVLRWPYAENDRAQAERKTTGLIKIVVSKGGKIEGATIAGEGAGEMINLWALAVTKEMKVNDIAAYVPPYPTMSEIGKRAATTYLAPQAKRPIVRKVLALLRSFG